MCFRVIMTCLITLIFLFVIKEWAYWNNAPEPIRKTAIVLMLIDFIILTVASLIGIWQL